MHIAMRQSYFFVANCIAVFAISVVAEDGLEPRIIGGHIVKNKTEIPYQVSLQFSGAHFCGGSIIDSKNVLTAGHCVCEKKEPHVLESVKVVAGDLRLQQNTNRTQVSDVSKIWLHENFTQKNKNDFYNDIAVLRLAQPFTFNAYVKAVNLPETTVPPKTNNCMISGWGYDKVVGGDVSPNLRAANITYIDTKFCNTTIFNGQLKPGMICAGSLPESTRDACMGDTGGPLVCDTSLCGVISWKANCSDPDYPRVYIDVAYYKTWIQRKQKLPSPAIPTTSTSTTTSTSSTTNSGACSSSITTSTFMILATVLIYY